MRPAAVSVHESRSTEGPTLSLLGPVWLDSANEAPSDRSVLSCPEVLPATGTSFVDRRSADIGFIDLLIRVGAYG